MRQRWEAGEIGCGRLVTELRDRMNRLEPGEQLEVVSESAGAPLDLPAWCQMTGHRLVLADHPLYVIERRASHPRATQSP